MFDPYTLNYEDRRDLCEAVAYQPSIIRNWSDADISAFFRLERDHYIKRLEPTRRENIFCEAND